MSFYDYDRWLVDFEYDSDPSPPRRSSPPSSRRDRTGSLPSRSSGPVVGDDGWEVIPEDLLKPENWGLPPTSLSHPSSPAPHPGTQEIVTNPGMMTSKFDTRRGQVVQFYPDHDPDLINTAQLDGLPYLLQPSSSLVPKVIKGAACNASAAKRKPLPLSYKWEQGLLETAYQNPESLVNYARIPPGRRGGFKSFRDLRGDEEGGQEGMGSSGGAVTGPNFGQFGGGRGHTASALPSMPPNEGFASGGPGLSLGSGGGSGGGGQPLGGGAQCGLPTIHETHRTVGGGYSGNASSSRQVSRQAFIRRDASMKEQQMRNKEELAREDIMKEVRKKEKAQAAKEKREAEEKEAERVKRDRAARDRAEKSKDVRSLAAEAAKRRDAATKDLHHQRAENLKEERERKEREKAERARERLRKKREEEEERCLMAEEKRDRDREARDARIRNTEEKSKDARQLAGEAAERRLKALEREKQAEERAKPEPKPPSTPTPAKSSGLKAGPIKPAPKPSSAQAKTTPAPAKKVTVGATRKLQPTPVKTTLPSRPAARAPPPPAPAEESDEESKLTP